MARAGRSRCQQGALARSHIVIAPSVTFQIPYFLILRNKTDWSVSHPLLRIIKAMQSSSTTQAVACSYGPAATADELRDIHRSSVIRHAGILADDKLSADAKIMAYFKDLRSFMENHQFRGCPYTNALSVSRGKDEKITQEVLDHKEFVREFFIAISGEITPSQRAQHVGEHLFLIYSGATTESQNLRAIWPIERALDIVKQILIEEKAYKKIETVSV